MKTVEGMRSGAGGALPSADTLDRDDPLRAQRDQFSIPQGLLYFAGHSLGAPRLSVSDRLAEVEREWRRHLVRAWGDCGWIDLPRQVGAKLASLIGAAPDEVVCADSTSVNLYKTVFAALPLAKGRRVILTERDNFPTDLYILEGLARQARTELRVVESDQIQTAIDGDVAVVALSHVNYKSAAIHDMAGITAAAHKAGALTVWDLSHAAGCVEVKLDEAEADFAVGCGYKYLNGGPGAPGYLFAAQRHQAVVTSPLQGWLGHAAPFAFEEDFRPQEGIERFLCGSPPIISMAALDASLDLHRSVGVAALQAKTRKLTDYFIAQMDEAAAGMGFELVSPRDSRIRGGHVAYRHPEGYPIMAALIERGVVGDFRAPDNIRFGCSPLYLRFRDVADAVARLVDVMETGAWKDPKYQTRAKVT
ncbi:MAG TPA: kynureninase [Stellaceae bacterium]|nr:kynureninase [Stellaceae bacterium]